MSEAECQTVVGEPPQGEPAASSKVSWRRTLIRVGVSALTLGILFAILPRQDLWAALVRVPLWTWGAGVAMYLSLHLLGVTKWRLTVNLSGAELGWAQAARCYYGGLFGNLFLPSILGGDLVRAGLAFRQARCRTGLVLGSILDRLIDLTALAVVAALGVALLPDRIDDVLNRTALLIVAAAAVVGILALTAVWYLIPARRLPVKIRRRLVKLRQVIRLVARRPQYVLVSLVLGITLQTCLVLLNAWLGQACGLECSLAVWLVVWPLAKLSGVLPITQGGVGVREAALAALFKPFGVPGAMAVAVGLVFQAVVITGALISGPLAYGLGRFPALHGKVARA